MLLKGFFLFLITSIDIVIKIATFRKKGNVMRKEISDEAYRVERHESRD